MRSASDPKSVPPLSKGMTLIEVIIYIVLLSILIAGFINFAFATHFQDIHLIHDIEDSQKSS